jgi:trans-aconitate 2-methyltransferase
MTPWNPEQYLRFGDERTRPARDLVARVRVDAPTRVIDLGCGPGNSTHALGERWPRARVCGLDSSAAMIAAARSTYPGQEWFTGTIERWEPDEPFDVVFSNAALQWVSGHATLVPRLFGHVAPGGALAFQIPSGAYSPVRALIDEVAGDAAWASRMADARRALTMEAPDVYYDALAPRARAVDIWETEYQHVMPSALAIVDWMSSTGLRPYLEALDADEDRVRFVGMLAERVGGAYRPQSDGRVLFPFRRTFVIAYA